VIEPLALRAAKEAQVHPLVIAIPRFTQLMVLLPPLKSIDFKGGKGVSI
jgi:hypothetical protein